MKRALKKEPKWKLLFITLLTVNIFTILLLIGVGYKLFKPTGEREFPEVHMETNESESPFYIHTSKEKLSSIINHFLNESETDFTILLDEYVELFGETQMLGMTISLHSQFEPIVEPNGNLLLKQRTVSFGLLQIPNHYALQYIKNILTLPEFVSIYPYEETIYIDSEKLTLGDSLKVKVSQFDLEQNEIVFALDLTR